MTTSVVRFLWRYLSKLKILFFGTLSMIFMGEVFYKLAQYCGAQIVDLISNASDKETVLQGALVYAGVLAGLLFLHRLAYDMILFADAKYMPLYLARVSKDLFSYAHQHSTAFFAEEMAGNISAKIKTIIDNSYNFYFQIMWGFAYPLFSTLVTVVMIATAHVGLALIMLLFNVIYVFAIFKMNKKVTPYSQKRAALMSEQNGVLVDSISNAPLVKSFSHYPFERKHYFKHVKTAVRAERAEIVQFGKLYMTQGALRAVLQICFYIFPILLWYKGEIGVGDFVLVQAMATSMVGIYHAFTQSFMQFFKLHGGIRDGLILLSRPYDVTDKPGALPLKVDDGEIRFENVRYHYKKADPLFDEFNLTLKPGEKVGLVGRSGSGKTTLAKILSRYYDIQEGRILIDGQDIRDITQASLRQNIALIPQDPSLFNRLLIENIRYGRLDATDEEVIEACKKANIHDFILTMKDGYQAKVGERGVMLSGGERQRIAIARAILKNAKILVLDEATSALDSASEKYIQEAMKDLMKGKTVLVIAHRLSTLKEMDRIVVMDKGKIVEEGTHTALLRKKGVYHGFYEMQSQGFL